MPTASETLGERGWDRICVVLVNWNGWMDTLECLESVLRSTGPEVQVVVCDNDSGDGSLESIRMWAEGRLDAWVPPSSPLRQRSFPPVAKPVPYVEYDRATAERGGGAEADAARLVLVRTGGNLGFAGGTNVGLRFALARCERGYVWILNNDTVVAPDALEHLVREIRRDSRVGIVGSTLLYYDDPDRVQTLGGGRYNPWLALSYNIGQMQPAGSCTARAGRMAYVVGASMLVSREFLDEIGLLSEEYFLYFEELDWAMRARGRYRLAHAPGSVVYHKEGGSIGAGTRDTRKSWTADYHFMRNRIVFTRKFLPRALPTVYLALLVSMARRARRGEWDRVRMIAELCLNR
jgi:GT2 family glycosyltransferase